MNERKIDPKLTPEREQFYARLSQYALAPLWERLNILLTKTPQVASQPCLWDYEACKSLLFEIGGAYIRRRSREAGSCSR